MKLGELFINIVAQGDTKKLDETIAKMEKIRVKEKAKVQFKEKILKINRLIAKATKEEQIDRLKNIKSQITENYVNDFKLTRLKEQSKALKEQHAQWKSMIRSVRNFAIGITTAIIAMDRLGNSILKANQLYISFGRQTGISINRLNKMIGLAKLSGMNLPAEQVASDIASLQQKIFRLGITGEGSGIFAQLGMNPMGMDSDQFINALRKRFQGMSEMQKSYVLDELGLSKEWLNVLNLQEKEYKDLIRESKKLQLNEEERKQLAKYTLIQQKNNMRWELAKQKLAIALLPIITKIMEVASKIAISLENAFGNENFLRIVRDISLLMTAIAVQAGIIKKTFQFLGAFTGFKALGGLFKMGGLALGFGGAKGFKALGKLIGKRMAAGAAATAVGGPVGLLIDIGLAIWTIVDILNFFKSKDEKADETPVDDSELRYQYRSINSNMVNHFYNNPQPQQAVTQELDLVIGRYLASTKR